MEVANRWVDEGAPGVARTMSVIAQDPSVRDAKGNILMATIQVPHEALGPGPTGYRVQVVDYDATTGRFYGAHELPAGFTQEPRSWRQGRLSIVGDYRFHAQNVYALVMRTLARFERALGRRIGWSFATHQLKVAPHGMLDANAFYTKSDEGLVLLYFPGRSGSTVYTCLSHDVVVHETTHALIDALRERYLDPSSPDQAAFHEGFSDLVALLSVFAQPELLRELLRRGRRRTKTVSQDTIHASDMSPEALKRSALFGLAEQMGQEMEGVRGGVLRRSATLPPDPTLRDSLEFLEPHRRGELLVAAALHAFVTIWAERAKALATHGNNTYSLVRAAEEGADLADVFLTTWIRALDYMPPVHLEFEDVLSAALTADLEARPDDSRFHLRSYTQDAFRVYGFGPAAGTEASGGIWNPAPTTLDYRNVHFESMRSDKDEVFRFVWENRRRLGLRSGAYTQVLSVRPCTRVGVDGFTLRETVVEYYQVARLTVEELRERRITPPAGWVAELKRASQAARQRRGKALGNAAGELPQATDDEGDELTTPLYGGGTLIFDEYGKLKFHIHNDVFGPRRQSRRLEYLYRAGLLKTGRLGARLSTDRLSTMHRLRALDVRRSEEESW
jgi:hypothetical protein